MRVCEEFLLEIDSTLIRANSRGNVSKSRFQHYRTFLIRIHQNSLQNTFDVEISGI